MRGLDFLLSLGSEWQTIGAIGLESPRRLLAALGNPQDSLRVVHVAGTNGKGSVSAAVSSIIASSGATVGTYTSPHLQDLSERLMLNGRPVAYNELDACLTEVAEASSSISMRPSFFEVITAAAFLLFAKKRVDWVVCEVGLGGRLDATNVVSKPAACVVTTIDFDHQQQLGNTLSEIAYEKAGIIKPGSIVLLGKMEEEPRAAILKVCQEKQVKALIHGKDFFGAAIGYREFEYKSGTLSLNYSSKLPGAHQADNIALAISTCLALGFDSETCSRGVSRVFWPGRLEEIEWKGRQVVLDCAHNPAGVSTLVSYLKSRQRYSAHCLFGVLASKEWKEMLNQLTEVVQSWVLLEPENHRSLPNVQVRGHLSCAGISNSVLVNKTSEALNVLENNSRPGELIVVCGSMYMLGAVRPALGAPPIRLW